MTYEEILTWLYGLEATRGMDFRLERLTPVLDRLEHPELAFPSVHVAGTNGKGSTAAMLHSIYSRAGYKTGLYTSPHLLSFRERIRVDDDMITEGEVVERVSQVKDAMEAVTVDLTFFEITTLAAFLHFRACEVELAIIEAGLGGRLDATNVVRSVATVITSVALEHEEYLGHTITDIAAEKAGILRGNVPLVTGDLPEEAVAVIEQRVEETGSPWLAFGRDFSPYNSLQPSPELARALRGEHQRKNAGVAVAVTRMIADLFPMARNVIESGLAATRWPGRFDIIDRKPRIVLDGAHNPEAAAALRATLEAFELTNPRVLVFGVMKDKDWREMLCQLIAYFDHVILVPVDNPRSLDPREPRELVEGLRPCDIAASGADGVRMAERIAGRYGTVVITGSFYLVGELYRLCGGAEDAFASA